MCEFRFSLLQVLPHLLQLHRPVRVVQKRLPTRVAPVVEFDAEDGVAARLDRLGDEAHGGLVGRAAALADVALEAGADDVLPRGRAALAARGDVVERQFAGGEALAAILTAVAIAGIDVAPVEFDILARQAVVDRQADDPRHGDVDPHGANPVVGVRLVALGQVRQVAPLREVVGGVAALVDVDDLGQFAAQQAEGPLHVDDADGEVVPVENKNAGTQC